MEKELKKLSCYMRDNRSPRGTFQVPKGFYDSAEIDLNKKDEYMWKMVFNKNKMIEELKNNKKDRFILIQITNSKGKIIPDKPVENTSIIRTKETKEDEEIVEDWDDDDDDDDW